CIDKVPRIRQMAEELGVTIDIEVDGGINSENIKEALDAGANVIVAGSAVFKNDIRANVEALDKQM
ncbi:MAG: ribulose-phosphate 3-epimerase, partial [Lachnospiraceae bacterium]|nr:ribulose-phosphate 3-epimerase [Lachnospiraceae bacterium]